MTMTGGLWLGVSWSRARRGDAEATTPMPVRPRCRRPRAPPPIPPSTTPTPSSTPTPTASEFDVVVSEPRFIIPSDSSAARAAAARTRTTTSTSSSTSGRLFLAWRTAPHHFAGPDTHMYIMSSADNGATWQFEHDVFLGTDMREPRLLDFGGYLQLMFFEAGSDPGRFEPMRLWRDAAPRAGAVVGPGAAHRLRRGAVGPQGPRRHRLPHVVRGRALRQRRHLGDRGVLQAVDRRHDLDAGRRQTERLLRRRVRGGVRVRQRRRVVGGDAQRRRRRAPASARTSVTRRPRTSAPGSARRRPIPIATTRPRCSATATISISWHGAISAARTTPAMTISRSPSAVAAIWSPIRCGRSGRRSTGSTSRSGGSCT